MNQMLKGESTTIPSLDSTHNFLLMLKTKRNLKVSIEKLIEQLLRHRRGKTDTLSKVKIQINLVAMSKQNCIMYFRIP